MALVQVSVQVHEAGQHHAAAQVDTLAGQVGTDLRDPTGNHAQVTADQPGHGGLQHTAGHRRTPHEACVITQGGTRAAPEVDSSHEAHRRRWH